MMAGLAEVVGPKKGGRHSGSKQWTGQSNYAYACARVKARRARLLSKDTYAKLLVMGLPQISRFLGETQYKDEMTDLALKYEGIELIELALVRDLSDDLSTVMRFCRGELRYHVQKYLEKWDIENLITVLRGRAGGEDAQGIMKNIVPVGKYGQRFWSQLVALENQEDLVKALKRTTYYASMVGGKGASSKLLPLEELEDNLHKQYFLDMLDAIKPNNRPNLLLLNYMKREIDVQNLKTLLRMKSDGQPAPKIMKYLIPGGYELTSKELQAMSQAEDMAHLQQDLVTLSSYAAIKDELALVSKTRTLTYVLRDLDRHHLATAKRFAYLYPLSVLPIINYFIGKRVEVENLRLLAWGKERNVREETMKNLLVV